MMKHVDAAAFALRVMGCVTTADAIRRCPRLSRSPPTSLFSPYGKGRQAAPLQCSLSFLRRKKKKKTASPGPKKQAPPKGSLVLRLSRQAEDLIVLECLERQESALAPGFVLARIRLYPARRSHQSGTW